MKHLAPIRLSVLGSTGSIGQQTLDIVRRDPARFSVTALSAGRNLVLLEKQIAEFRPRVVAGQDEDGLATLRTKYPDVQFIPGEAGNLECACHDEVDLVVVGIVGFAALRPTLAAVRHKKRLALANKEILVAAGELLNAEVGAHGVECIPVDSEHNALFQLLRNARRDEVKRLVITASGGPLLRRPDLPLTEVTPEIAVKHPNWAMGPKISVDSATLMNKGLELIEACILFGYAASEVEVWIHPQSILHGALLMKDNTLLAQLSRPDMHSSISYALYFPERMTEAVPALGFSELRNLEFLPPDENRFQALRLCRAAHAAGPAHRIALNASNEIAVRHFLERKLCFSKITHVIEEVLSTVKPEPVTNLETVFALDESYRRVAEAIALQFAF